MARMKQPVYTEPAVGWNNEDNHAGVTKFGVANYEGTAKQTVKAPLERPSVISPCFTDLEDGYFPTLGVPVCCCGLAATGPPSCPSWPRGPSSAAYIPDGGSISPKNGVGFPPIPSIVVYCPLFDRYCDAILLHFLALVSCVYFTYFACFEEVCEPWPTRHVFDTRYR